MGLCRAKEPPYDDDADGEGGEGGEQQVKMTPSLASHLLSHHKRVSLLRCILSFHQTRNPKEYINLRSSSKLFRNALRPPLVPTFQLRNPAESAESSRRAARL